MSKKPNKIGVDNEDAALERSEQDETVERVAVAVVEAEESKEPTKVDFESRVDLDEAVAYFEAITAGLKKGTLTFRQGSGAMQLIPNRQVDMKVKASKKGEKGKIVFEIAWKSAKKEEFSIS